MLFFSNKCVNLIHILISYTLSLKEKFINERIIKGMWRKKKWIKLKICQKQWENISFKIQQTNGRLKTMLSVYCVRYIMQNQPKNFILFFCCDKNDLKT